MGQVVRELRTKLDKRRHEVEKLKSIHHEFEEKHRAERATLKQQLMGLEETCVKMSSKTQDMREENKALAITCEEKTGQVEKTLKEIEKLRRAVDKLTKENHEKLSVSEKETTILET